MDSAFEELPISFAWSGDYGYWFSVVILGLLIFKVAVELGRGE